MDTRDYWEKEWEAVDHTLKRDVGFLIDSIKLEYLLPLLPQKGKTLEVGSGSGRLSCFLSSRGYVTICLDFSEQALRVAKTNYSISKTSGYFVRGDALHLPFKNEVFDVVISTGLIEHFQNPNRLIKEMVKVLGKKCLFYSDIVPKKFSLLRIFRFYESRHHKRQEIGGFEGKYKKKEIEYFLLNANLSNVHVFSMTVLLPSIPLMRRSKLYKEFYIRILYVLKPFWMFLDNSALSDLLGFQYFAYGYKRL